MYSKMEIDYLKDLIIETIKPEKIILFGSYAYGTPTEKSDIDLLVVMPDEELSFEDTIGLGVDVENKLFERPVYIKNDVCIIAQSDYREMREVPISAVYFADRKGVVLFDKGKMESNLI